MSRTRVKALVDVVLLSAATLTFASGLVLLLEFHVGLGCLKSSALGLSRLAWLNLHRLPALLAALGLALHLGLDWRTFVAKLRRFFRRARGSSKGSPERALYLSFWLVALTGLGLWLLLAGSAPLLGPVALGQAPHLRHHVVDVHNVAGLLALPLTIHHVAHRWRWLVRALRVPRNAISPSERPELGR